MTDRKDTLRPFIQLSDGVLFVISFSKSILVHWHFHIELFPRQGAFRKESFLHDCVKRAFWVTNMIPETSFLITGTTALQREMCKFTEPGGVKYFQLWVGLWPWSHETGLIVEEEPC